MTSILMPEDNMLTKNQEGYLSTIPDGKIAHIVPFDPATQITAREIILEIKSIFPLAKIFYIGSSKLGIAGENDIDITVSGEADFDRCFKIFNKLYGIPESTNLKEGYVKWVFSRNNFPVELHLMSFITPEFQQQIDIQDIFENNKNLCLKYEKMKIKCDGISQKEYLMRKYEFWNRMLGN